MTIVHCDYMERHSDNVCMQLNSPASWIYVHQSALGYSECILPIFYKDVITRSEWEL